MTTYKRKELKLEKTLKKQELAQELIDGILNKYAKSLEDFKFDEFFDLEEVGKDDEDKPIFGVNLESVEKGFFYLKGNKYKFNFVQTCRVESTLDELKYAAFTRYWINFYAISDLEVNGEAADDELQDCINAKMDYLYEEFYPNFAALSSFLTHRIVDYIHKKFSK